AVERHQTYAGLIDPLWEAKIQGRVHVITSELTIMECMVGPLSRADPGLIADFERFFASPFAALLPVDRSVLIRAAIARAGTKTLRAPDAIHLATALTANADCFVTNDQGLARHVPIDTVLVDHLVSPATG
ncbi:MAG: type II toxin-antitoxin system VapC family toxin, partial [Planctomycetota bacterium]|nr:type II toxin-antitoxin system VapC family toxin [Planctomycetota bacterium]